MAADSEQPACVSKKHGQLATCIDLCLVLSIRVQSITRAAAGSGGGGGGGGNDASDDIEMEQLIVGVLLFTPLLLLLPTTLVFLVFAMTLHAAAVVVQCCLAAGATAAAHNPAALLALRVARPGLFPTGVTFEVLMPGTGAAGGWGEDSRGSSAMVAGEADAPQIRLQLVSRSLSAWRLLAPCCKTVLRRAQNTWTQAGMVPSLWLMKN